MATAYLVCQVTVFSRSVALANVVIMLHPDVPLTVGQVARAAGLKYTPAHSALTTLEKRGIVRRVTRAGHDAFQPDRDDPHYPAAYLTALIDLPIAAALGGERVYRVVAYGSLATPGGGTSQSDLDLLIVGDISDRAALSERLAEVGARLGRAIDPWILDPERLDEARRTHDPHVESALLGVRILGSA